MPEDIVELEDEKQNRVRACQGCTTSLINQWTVYQRDQIPVEERAYVYESPLGMLKYHHTYGFLRDVNLKEIALFFLFTYFSNKIFNRKSKCQ